MFFTTIKTSACIILSTFCLLINSINAQVHFYNTYPDYTFEDQNKKESTESTDWEYATVAMLIQDQNSSFEINFLRQTKDTNEIVRKLQLKQVSEWAIKENMDACVVETSDKLLRYLLFYSSSSNFINQSGLYLMELTANGKEGSGRNIYLKNYLKNHRESMMFIHSDGLSAYQYTLHFNNALFSSNLLVARKYVKDAIELCYTAQDVRIKQMDEFLRLSFPVEDPYKSILVHRNITRNLRYNEGVYTYRNDSIPSKDGNYGFSTGDIKTGFDKFKYSWFAPDNIEIVDFKSNRKGKWQKTSNGLVFTAEKGVNNILFTISFKINNTQAKEIEKTIVSAKEIIQLPSTKVRISIWDNNKVDGDIISLSLNGEWIVRNLEVSACKTTFTLDLPSEDNYLVMKAENLGTHPPNTAAFLIESGDFSKQITLNSDLGKSEMMTLKTKQ